MTVSIEKMRILAASVIMPRLEPEEYRLNEDYRNTIHALIHAGVCGFCVFKGELEHVRTMIQELQTLGGGRLLFSGDFEYGISMRIHGGTDFPHAMALGMADDGDMTEKIAAAVAHETRALGVHWNFAPVCDINSNPQNPIVNIRSFGETPARVMSHCVRWIHGTQAHNVIACAKHFPGHGDTATDSHLGLPVLPISADHLRNHELLPFKKAIEAGVRSVMMGHLAVPSLDASGAPASLSFPLVTDLLREKLGFKGIIVTDALDMGAITSIYTSEQAAIAAIEAGIDVVLLPQNPQEALEGLAQYAMNNPHIHQRLIESSLRIDKEKQWCFAEQEIAAVNLQEYGSMAFHAARAAVRISGDRGLIPLPESKSFAAFAVMQNDNPQPGVNFFHFVQQIVENDCDFGFMNADITDEEIDAYREQTATADIVIFALFIRARSHTGTVGIAPKINEAAQRIANGRPMIAILLGSPYIRSSFDADTYITTYSDSLPGIAAAAVALTKGV